MNVYLPNDRQAWYQRYGTMVLAIKGYVFAPASLLDISTVRSYLSLFLDCISLFGALRVRRRPSRPNLLEMIQLRFRNALAEQNPAFEEPWQLFLDLELGVPACCDAEDVIKFFQSPLLCLGHEQPDHEEGKNV